MTTRYTQEHYEDVARLLKGPPTTQGIVHDFADLFATDNPPLCPNCKVSVAGVRTDCSTPEVAHILGGFDRAQFLVACGLESEE